MNKLKQFLDEVIMCAIEREYRKALPVTLM